MDKWAALEQTLFPYLERFSAGTAPFVWESLI